MESRGMASVTLPDLCCHRGLCSAPRLQAGALLIESDPAKGACHRAHVHLNVLTPVADRGNWI